FTEAIRLNPNYTRAYTSRGVALAEQQDFDRAVVDQIETVRQRPRGPEGYHNLALVWLTWPDGRMRNARMAHDLALRACELSGFEEGAYLVTLARACAELGDAEAAGRWLEKALPLARTAAERARWEGLGRRS